MNNKIKEVYTEKAKFLDDYIKSNKIREELKFPESDYSFCVTTDESLLEEIYNYIINRCEGKDNKEIIEEIYKSFYIKIASQVIGYYYLVNHEVNLTKEEIDYLVYEAIGLVLFIISGRYGEMMYEAATHKS